jgi:hypothetical protein
MILNTILLRIKRWKVNRMQPVLKIHNNHNTIITREINLKDQEGNKIPFFVNRIAVSNSGKSVAKDCQIYIEFAQNKIKQVAWALPDCDTSLSITIDVGVPQHADLCAITQDGYFRRVVNERGLKECTVDETVPLPGPQDIPAVIRIVSSNAKPMERKIIFHANFMPDENNPGRIVEFQ